MHILVCTYAHSPLAHDRLGVWITVLYLLHPLQPHTENHRVKKKIAASKARKVENNLIKIIVVLQYCVSYSIR